MYKICWTGAGYAKILIATLVIVGMAQAAQAGDWPMFRHDAAHSGVSDETVEPPLKLLWKYNAGTSVFSSPAVSGGVVYGGTWDGNVYALDAATGALKWKYTTGPYVFSSPAVSGGVVYVGSDNNNLYALETATGNLKWKYTTGGSVTSSPAVSNGVIYVGSADYNVYALDAATGALKWKYTTGGSVTSSPAVSNGVIYVGSGDYNVYALDAVTGALKWKYRTDYNILYSSPAVSGGIVYVSSVGIYALDASTGALKWKYDSARLGESSPAVSDGVVYVGSSADGIYALDASTGVNKWKYRINAGVPSSPAISGGRVYVGSYNGNVYAFTPGGDGSDVGETPISTPYQNAQTQESMKESGIVVLGKMVSWFDFAVFMLSMFIALGIGTTKLFKRKSLNGIFYKLGLGFAVFLWFWVVLSGKILSWFEFSVYTLFMMIALGIGTTKLFKRNSLTGIFYKLGFGFAVLFFLFAWLASHLSFLISSIVILTFGIVVLSLHRRESSPQHAPEQPSRAGSDILDAGYVLSKEASSLFNKKDYDGSLKIYSKALDKFLIALKHAKGDASLAKSIENNILSTRKNILACKSALGISVSEDAKLAFEEERCEDAEQLYNTAVEHFENALKDAEELEDADEINKIQALISKTKSNINSCYIAADKKKVEELSRRADILFKEATANREKRELFKAREALKKASDTIDEAFTLATNRSFSDAQRTLGDLLRSIRNEMNAIDTLISGGVEQIKPFGEVSEITTEQPDIDHETPFPQYSPQDFTPSPTTPRTFPPELQPKYTDIEFLGKGGFARVFKARRKSDGKVVAVKIPISLDEATGKSFLKEIKAWEEMKHPNIVEMYDMNIMPLPYFEMEYVENKSIEELKKPIEVEKAAKIVFDIAEGLKYAHARGIIHRDLKPHNVLLTSDMNPKITDWGLSKVLAESKTTTLIGFTIACAAPEQVSPKQFGKADERTDIYQLGVIFYELVTGKLPFDGDSIAEISSAIIKGNPAPPSTLNPEAKDVEHIILKCLAKNQGERYQSAQELQKALADYLKLEYKESLKESTRKKDITRSRLFCGDLVLISAKIGDYTEVLKYLSILKDYAKPEETTDIENLMNELDYRLKEGISPGEDFADKIKILAYRVQMK